jgi:type IX secretion system PorP/SprF family membrane protein
MKNMTAVKVSAIVLLMLVVGLNSKVNAQYDAMFTQYMNNEMFINPAYAGSKEALAITALHRQQWVGVAGRPITTTLTVHAPLMAGKMGIGLSLMNEEIGVSSRNMIYVSYAYRIRTGDKGFLSFGLMGGIHLQSENLASVGTTEGGDPNFSANTGTIITPNFGFGINYYTDKFYAGIAIPRLIDDHLTVGKNGDVIKATGIKPASFHYFLTVGRIFTVTDNFKLKPSLMVKAVLNAPMQFDINLSSLIKEHLWLGLSYRTGADISALVGVQISPRFLISYSYDYPLNDIRTITSGSHEIVLGLLFGYKGKKVVSNRYF